MESLISFLAQYDVVPEKMLALAKSIFQLDYLKKGDYFIREGEYASEVAFLESGVVRAFYTDLQGKEYNKTLFVGPSIIGSYAALISKEKNRLPQQALTDCTIWRADFDKIERLSEGNYDIERLRRRISEQYFVRNEKKQVEFALLEAKERYLIFKNEYPGLEDVIPQYHIASYLGISATQLSRIRKNRGD